MDENSEGSIFYADMELHIHRTVYAVAKHFKFLGLVAAGSGISVFNWVACWIDSRTHWPFILDGREGESLVSAQGDDGQPLSRAVGTHEAGKWLKPLLGESLARSEFYIG